MVPHAHAGLRHDLEGFDCLQHMEGGEGLGMGLVHAAWAQRPYSA